MSEQDALLAAVCADPDTDLPRLVYADWLDDHGEPARAEFIRLQCAPNPSADQHRRADELLAAHYPVWVGPLARFEPVFRDPGEVRFRRGFIWGVQIDDDEDDFGDYAEPLFRTAPIQRINFVCRYRHASLVECPQVLQLRELGTDRAGFETPELAVLFASPYLRNVERLELTADDDNGHLGVDGLRLLGECRNLPALRELDLSGNWCGWGYDGPADWPAALLDGRLASQLTWLSLSATMMRDEGAEAIASCGRLAGLTHLDLTHNYLGARGLLAIARSRHLRSLRTLDVRGNTGSEDDPPAALEGAHAALVRRFSDGVRFK